MILKIVSIVSIGLFVGFEKYKRKIMIEFKDLVGEIFLILIFLGMAIGVIIADKIRKKK